MTELREKLEALDKATGPAHKIGVHIGRSEMPEPVCDYLAALVDAYRSGELVTRAPIAAPTGDAVGEAVEAFKAAISAMPWGQTRLANGEQFNCYESASNDEDDDPCDWEYYVALGPISDFVTITGLQSEWRAQLIESALRVALTLTRITGKAAI
jgi:hypothetical protein